MPTHVRILAWLFLTIGSGALALAALSSVALGAAARWLHRSPDLGDNTGAAFVGLTSLALAVFCVSVGLPSLICGWGLLRLRRWARMLAIVLAAVALVKFFPVGTVFGAYAFWVLFRKDTEAHFTR